MHDGLTRAERRRIIKDMPPPGQLREWPLFMVSPSGVMHTTRRWSTHCRVVPGAGWREATADERGGAMVCKVCERRSARC